MNLHIQKSTLHGLITVPPSKSQSIRAILFASLAKGTSTILNPLSSPDIDVIINACKNFGAKIAQSHNQLTIEGVAGKPRFKNPNIDVQNSGLALRFITALAALDDKKITVTGDHSIQTQRSMSDLLQGLNQLGAKTSSNNGFAPLTIQGPITPNSIYLDGQDSQPVSAALILSSLLNKEINIYVKNPGEKPWVDMTLQWLKKMEVNCTHENYHHFKVKGNAPFAPFNYTVPGDFSSAAFPLGAAIATKSTLSVQHLDMNDSQGDKKILEILKKMGAKFQLTHGILRFDGSAPLTGCVIDINDCIDAITILAVIGCFAKGKTTITNAAVARGKECNRIECIAKELSKMGGKVTETEDGLEIIYAPLHGGKVNSHGDHRMALSLAVAGMGASSETFISNTECIAKTYGSFVNDFKMIGASINGK